MAAFTSLVAVALLVFAGLPDSTEDEGSRQVVRGTVMAPMEASGMCTNLERHAESRYGLHGLFAVRFDVDPETRGLPFVLSPEHPADLDIFFSPGDTYAHRNLRGEGGIVPSTAEEAYVCLVAGGPTQFTYRAG